MQISRGYYGSVHHVSVLTGSHCWLFDTHSPGSLPLLTICPTCCHSRDFIYRCLSLSSSKWYLLSFICFAQNVAVSLPLSATEKVASRVSCYFGCWQLKFWLSHQSGNVKPLTQKRENTQVHQSEI